MKRTAVIAVLLTSFLLVLPALGGTDHSLHPKLKIPDKVNAKEQACLEIIRLGKKYQVEELFPKEFGNGKGESILTRLDVALAVQLLTETMAARTVKNGPEAVSREDLVFVFDLHEELRAEMLLAKTRAFQMRYDELGTQLHPLTRNITISGGLVGLLQGLVSKSHRNYADVVGRGDLVFNFKVGKNIIGVIDIEATGGDGIDSHIASFSSLNGVAGSTDDRARFREAWLEYSAFEDCLIVTLGKISLTNYFDSNNAANSEISQFLAGAFVNSAVLGSPDNGPGIRAHVRLGEKLTFGAGYGSGDAESADIMEHGFGIAELAYRLKHGVLETNVRVYGTLDGSLPDRKVKKLQKNSFGTGVSLDQVLSEKTIIFGRYGWRDEEAYASKSAWSLGIQYTGPVPSRKGDVLGFGYGQVLAAGAAGQEKLAELYYRAAVSEQLAITTLVQYLINPMGATDADKVVVVGLRGQLSF